MKEVYEILDRLYTGPTKWELDQIIYADRLTNKHTLACFLLQIKTLDSKENLTLNEKVELKYLTELFKEIDEENINELVNQDEETSRDAFIETLARKSALESLTMGRLNYQTLDTACKLSPNEFILCAKRTQDLMNSIQGLVVKGENLSKDVAGA